MTQGRKMGDFLENGYRKVLLEAFEAGELNWGVFERRRAPRVKLQSVGISASVTPKISVENASTSGIAFFSDQPFSPGSEIDLTLQGILRFVINVISCETLDKPALPNLPFRIRCTFHDIYQGMQLLVVVKELEAPS